MKEKTNLEKLILDLVLSDKYQPLKPRQIAKKLKLPEEQERELKRTLKRLIKKGKLAYGPKHLIIRGHGKPEAKNSSQAKAIKKTDEVIGRFRRAAAGFGFVTPKDSVATDDFGKWQRIEFRHDYPLSVFISRYLFLNKFRQLAKNSLKSALRKSV